MKAIPRKFIDWKKTGKNLQLLRQDNIELRRCVCRALKGGSAECGGDCADCKFDMDNHISRRELSEVMGETEHIIGNWERGRTKIDYENLLFYAQIAKVELDDIVVFMECNV